MSLKRGVALLCELSYVQLAIHNQKELRRMPRGSRVRR